MEFQISEYLSDRNKRTNKGSCKLCLKAVTWARDNVASHKRKNCSDNAEEKLLFAKRPRIDTSLNNVSLVSVSDDSLSFDGF